MFTNDLKQEGSIFQTVGAAIAKALIPILVLTLETKTLQLDDRN